MIGRLAFVFAAAALLAGCTDADWDHAFAYAGLGGDKPAAQAGDTTPKTQTSDAAPPVAAAPDAWCVEVAKAAQTEAAQQGFDAQTQKNRAQTAFQQCARAPAAAQ